MQRPGVPQWAQHDNPDLCWKKKGNLANVCCSGESAMDAKEKGRIARLCVVAMMRPDLSQGDSFIITRRPRTGRRDGNNMDACALEICQTLPLNSSAAAFIPVAFFPGVCSYLQPLP